MLNGVDSLALTKLDVLDDLDEIPVCTEYNVHGERWKTFPAFAVAHHDYKPEYRVMKGWRRSTVGVTNFDDLPQQAKDYVRFIEDEIECPAGIVSTGPRREETIVRR
jgi:adenylosuccinate synthase